MTHVRYGERWALYGDPYITYDGTLIIDMSVVDGAPYLPMITKSCVYDARLDSTGSMERVIKTAAYVPQFTKNGSP